MEKPTIAVFGLGGTISMQSGQKQPVCEGRRLLSNQK